MIQLVKRHGNFPRCLLPMAPQMNHGKSGTATSRYRTSIGSGRSPDSCQQGPARGHVTQIFKRQGNLQVCAESKSRTSF